MKEDYVAGNRLRDKGIIKVMTEAELRMDMYSGGRMALINHHKVALFSSFRSCITYFHILGSYYYGF